MKKSLIFTVCLVCFTVFLYGQDPDKTDTKPWQIEFLSVLIGLVIGAVGGYFIGKKGASK